MLIIYLVRGLPGSGKSTLARGFGSSGKLRCLPILEADDEFMIRGEYHFDASILTRPGCHKLTRPASVARPIVWVLVGRALSPTRLASVGSWSPI